MNTKGHRGVGEQGALALLERTFKDRAGGEAQGLEAVLLGNWLTDLSQVIDPVAYASLASKVQSLVEDFVRLITATTLYRAGAQWYRTWTGDQADRLVRAVREKVYGALGVLLGSDPATRSVLWDLSTDAVFVKGYLAFGLPEQEGEPDRLSIEQYDAVFKAVFRQYFPHEHCDRPRVPMSPDTYETSLDRGPRAGQPTYRTPDLYRYLRDDIEILAAGFAELEADWARPVGRGELAVDGTDPDFAVGLARMGYLLHAVEDFYAHSNFVELHALASGPKYLPKPFETRDAGIFARRLKRWVPGARDGVALPTEDFVVTGYFDTQDTVVSLLHVFEEVLGIGWKDPRRQVGDFFRTVESTDLSRVEQEYYTWLQSVLEIFRDPVQAAENEDNRVMEVLKDKFGDNLETLAKPAMRQAVLAETLARTTYLKRLPAGILTRLSRFVLAVSKTIAVGKLAMSVYEAIDTVAKFLANPIAVLIDAAKDAGLGFAQDSALYLAKDLFLYERLLQGSDHRVGSHSLLAKDTGSEWLYGYQRACATAAHYVIVDTMLRRLDPAPPPDDQYVDWLALLEALMCNPLVRSTGRTEFATADAVELNVSPPSQVIPAIQDLAARRGVQEVDGVPGWMRVAASTFTVDDMTPEQATQLARAAVRKPAGATSAKGLITLVVPGQTVSVGSRPSGSPTTASEWPEAVFDRERSYAGKGWEVVRGYTSASRDQSVAPKTLVETAFVDESRMQQQILRGRDLRQRLEQAYHVLVIPPFKP
ncbi:hypothetical protein [Streptomyces sp. NBC_01304]|uniref:hypothetical protein n=1 Tax=Streptomyces sp. NBC_01304 TaxID=2903818 RepID=UPI002E12405C|nr:Het-C domain-containing protein [Streptomyces sp. NBC_01304]